MSENVLQTLQQLVQDVIAPDVGELKVHRHWSSRSKFGIAIFRIKVLICLRDRLRALLRQKVTERLTAGARLAEVPLVDASRQQQIALRRHGGDEFSPEHKYILYLQGIRWWLCSSSETRSAIQLKAGLQRQ